MDDARNCPSVPQAELESSAPDAPTPSKPDPTLIDMPGIGAVPASGALELSSAEALLLHDLDAHYEEYDRLLAGLIYAARDLAQSASMSAPHPNGSQITWCRECQMNAFDGVIPHAARCKVGRVDRLIAQLQSLVAPRGGRKEVLCDRCLKTQLPEQLSAGGESRSRGDFGEPWNWTYERIFEETRIFDREGTLIASISKRDRESGEWASRIVGCVNSCASKAPREIAPASDSTLPCDWAGELSCGGCKQKGGAGWSLLSQQSHCNRALAANEFEIRRGGWSYVYAHNCAAGNGGAR